MGASRSKEIEARIQAGARIREPELREWMRSTDLETAGAVMVLFDQYRSLLEALPPQEEVVDFYLAFFRRCLREDPRGEYAPSRYLAAHALVNWYRRMRADPQVAPDVLARARRMLREEYEQGDQPEKECIVRGALEHLFEDPAVREEFSDWRTEPALRIAYEEALRWSTGSA